jgi:predicted RNA methylase
LNSSLKSSGFTSRLLRAGRRVAQTVQDEGWLAAVRKIRDRISQSRPDDPFDRQYRIETAGKVSLFELDITSRNEAVGIRYQPSPPEVCDQLLASLPIHYEEFTFIDLGAGKGRVLLVGSRFPFKRLIGVEFARELVDTARRNIERFGCGAEVVHADAADYSFPSDNLVVYLYNPFGPEVLRPILSSLREIGAVREVYMLYLNPAYSSEVEGFARELYELAGAKVYHF